MEQASKTIRNAIQAILEQKPYKAPEVRDDSRLIEDLGFSSLDIAQLIAQLEMELDVDPFSKGALISNVRTVKSLSEIYQASLDERL